MSIRICEKEHIKQVIEIENRCFDHPYPDEVFYSYLGSELFIVYEISEDKNISGYVIGEEKAGYGVIISIAVLPSYRRRGIGTSLMKAVQSRMGAEYFFVMVRISNRSAIDFYKGLGFKKAGMIKGYYQNGEDGMVMKKRKN